MDASAAEQQIGFTCPYCGQRTPVAASFAGCVAPCAACGRDVLVPEREDWLAPQVAPSRARHKLWTPFSVVVWGSLGAAAGSILLAIPVALVAMSIIGVGVRDVVNAAMVGGMLGAFFGCLLGYRLCQD